MADGVAGPDHMTAITPLTPTTALAAAIASHGGLPDRRTVIAFVTAASTENPPEIPPIHIDRHSIRTTTGRIRSSDGWETDFPGSEIESRDWCAYIAVMTPSPTPTSQAPTPFADQELAIL